MKYYLPVFKLGVLCSPQTQIEDKLGGLPWGLPQNLWPVCKICGKSMGLVAQLLHDDERLNLGRNGRCLFVFMCCNADSQCVATWSSEEGGNSSFVIEPEKLGFGLVAPPDIKNPDSANIRVWHNCAYDQKWEPEQTIWIQTEARITKWESKDDNIPESARSRFLHGAEFNELDEDLFNKVYSGTKLGSVPAWVQYPTHEDFTFVGQFDSYIGFTTPIPDPNQVGCPVYVYGQRQFPKARRFDAPNEIIQCQERSSGKNYVWFCDGPNFGDAGCGYLFIKHNGGLVPRCEFIWQCA